MAALLLTVVAMFARNLLIVALLSPSAVSAAAPPLVVMAVLALIFVRRERASSDGAPAEIHLESPVSLFRVLTFAGFFVLIQVISTLGQRYLGKIGFLGVSVIGGFVSSASTSAAAANMVGHGQMRPQVAGEGVVLASIASALMNLPIVRRSLKDQALSRRLVSLTGVLCVVGIAILVLQEYFPIFRK
jgi:uncharacterized membrane protein (DUF4010 family)